MGNSSWTSPARQGEKTPEEGGCVTAETLGAFQDGWGK